MSVGPAVRLRIYKRDGYACVKCRRTQDLTIDHVIPRALGGSNVDENLQTMCKRCNNKKGDNANIPRTREARRRWFAALEAVQARTQYPRRQHDRG